MPQTTFGQSVSQQGGSIVPTAMGLNTLQNPPVPLNVAPPSVVPIPTLPAPVPNPDTATTNAPAPAPAPLTNLEQLASTLAGKTSDTAATTASATAPYEAQLNDINTAIANHQAQTISNQEQVMHGGGDASFQSGEGQRVARNDAIEGLRLGAIQAGLQGNITLAEKHAQQAIDAKYGQVDQDIQNAKTNIYNNWDTLSPAEKQRASNTLLQLNANDTFVKQQQEDEKTTAGFVQSAILQGAKNGKPVPTLILNQASKLPPDQALQLLSPYMVDTAAQQAALADLAYKRSQTAVNNIQVAKTQAEVDAATGKGGIPVQTYNDRNDTINLVNNILDNKYLGFALGGQNLNPLNYIPGGAVQPVKAQLDQLVAKLSLDNRSKLKGSGAISDFESRTLEKSASSFSRSLNYDDAVTQLKQIKGVLTTLNGGDATVLVKDPKTGETQTAQADTAAINKMISANLIVQYQ